MRQILLLMFCVSLLVLPLAAHAYDVGIPPGEGPDLTPLPILSLPMAKARGFLTLNHKYLPVSLPLSAGRTWQSLSMLHHPDNFRGDPLQPAVGVLKPADETGFSSRGFGIRPTFAAPGRLRPARLPG
ncbi:MAG: hypothetical protein C4542_02020 [Dehalococcoidia bacterium]|nr:MAG: hypothetical protein C4542_02020 [Dehalococcoidia bacterium]